MCVCGGGGVFVGVDVVVCLHTLCLLLIIMIDKSLKIRKDLVTESTGISHGNHSPSETIFCLGVNQRPAPVFT